MSILESFLPKYIPSPVPLEGVLGAWTAAKTFGGLPASGGQIVLTDQYLVFTPWDMTKTREWLFKLLAMAGAPSYIGKIDELITKSKLLDPVAIPLGEITGIQVLNRASTFKPPGARLTLRNGSGLELGILASPLSPNINPANNDAFDDWLAHMHQALASATQALRSGLAANQPAVAPAPPANWGASDWVAHLAGRWRLRGSSDQLFNDAMIDVNPNGSFTGRVVIFGGIPEGCLTTGTWFFVMGIPQFIAFQGKAVEPRLDEEVEIPPFAVPVQLLVTLEQITPDKMIGEAEHEGTNAPIEFDRLP